MEHKLRVVANIGNWELVTCYSCNMILAKNSRTGLRKIIDWGDNTCVTEYIEDLERQWKESYEIYLDETKEVLGHLPNGDDFWDWAESLRKEMGPSYEVWADLIRKIKNLNDMDVEPPGGFND